MSRHFYFLFFLPPHSWYRNTGLCWLVGFGIGLFFFFWFGIHTASVPSTAGTSTGGGAVLGKPEGSLARRHSRNIVLK